MKGPEGHERVEGPIANAISSGGFHSTNLFETLTVISSRSLNSSKTVDVDIAHDETVMRCVGVFARVNKNIRPLDHLIYRK